MSGSLLIVSACALSRISSADYCDKPGFSDQ